MKMDKTIQIGMSAKRNGKPVTVKAVTPSGMIVVQFKGDAESVHASTRRRHYTYHKSELTFSYDEIGIEYEISVFDDNMDLLNTTCVKDFPTTDVLLAKINDEYKGRYAQVQRRYVGK